MSMVFITRLLFTGPAQTIDRLAAEAAASASDRIAFHVNSVAGCVDFHDGQWLGEIQQRSAGAMLVKVGTDNYPLADRLDILAERFPSLRIHAATFIENGDAIAEEFANGRIVFFGPTWNRRRVKRGLRRFRDAVKTTGLILKTD